MKQFLRFQISGLTCIVWLVLFLLPCIDITKILNDGETKAIVALVGSVALGLPLGTVIHQISITLFSPFRKKRLGGLRTVLEKTSQIAISLGIQNTDAKNQSILVLKQGTKISNGSDKIKKEIDIEYIRQEISNRYSYYYVRMDNGLIAPCLAYIVFLFTLLYLSLGKTTILLSTPILPFWCIPFVAYIFCFMMLWYIPELLKETDDLENIVLLDEELLLRSTKPETPQNQK